MVVEEYFSVMCVSVVVSGGLPMVGCKEVRKEGV